MSNEEQTQHEVTTAPETTPGHASREDLIAAVKAAGGTASVDVDAEAAAVGAEPPVVEPTTTQEPDRLEAILKLREQKHAEAMAQRSSVQRIEEEARLRAERIVQEAEERARTLAQETAAQRARRYAEDPIAAIREDGIDPQRLADDLVRTTDPTQKELLQLRAELAKTQELAKTGQSAKEALDQFRQEQATERARLEVQAYEQHFLSAVATEQTAPHLHARYTPAQIMQEARATAQAWAKDGLKYGVDFDDALVVSYLENDSKKRIAKLIPSTGTPPANQVLAGAPATAPGSAPKVQANGPRTLSAAQGSERRTSPKPLHEMTPAQKKAALIEAAAEARRNNPEDY